MFSLKRIQELSSDICSNQHIQETSGIDPFFALDLLKIKTETLISQSNQHEITLVWQLFSLKNTTLNLVFVNPEIHSHSAPLKPLAFVEDGFIFVLHSVKLAFGQKQVLVTLIQSKIS